MRARRLLPLLIFVALAASCGAQEETGDSGREATAPRAAEQADLPESISTGPIPQPELETEELSIEGSGGEVRLEAEIAESVSETSRGLMAREELGENEGMLFVFGSAQQQTFIMENTLLPLSIAYIAPDGRIVNILQMEPLSDETYPSEEPAQYALEMRQGFFEENGVEEGDEVNIPRTLSEG